MKTYQNRLSNLGETCWLVKSQNEDLLGEQKKVNVCCQRQGVQVYIQET